MQTAILAVSDHQTEVGQRLRDLIDALGLLYVDAANVMGVSKGVLNNWMAGDSYPNPYPIYRLCKAKGVNYDWVFLGDPGRLPHEVAKRLEEIFQSRLEAALGSEVQEPERRGRKRPAIA